jgi:hypothetical protein
MSNEQNSSDANAHPVDTLVKQCYTCRNWQGDKKKVLEQIENYPMSMDKFKGWTGSGSCGIAYEWSDLYVHGDATATLEVNANFGCPYWNA